MDLFSVPSVTPWFNSLVLYWMGVTLQFACNEADPNNVSAVKNVVFQAAYRSAPRMAGWKFGSTEITHGGK